MKDSGLDRLRERLRRHNRRVALVTVMALVLAAALWGGLFFVAWWLFVLGGAVARPLSSLPAVAPLLRAFIATAVVLCTLAWIGKRLRPNDIPADRKGLSGHLLDIVLAAPRLTLAVFGTWLAVARLSRTELEYAWEILRRMNEAETPVRISELSAEIPDPAMRDRIVMALQLGEVIELRPSPNGPILKFRSDEARQLAEDRVRLRY